MPGQTAALAGKTPVTNLPPWEAAKRIRIILRALRTRIVVKGEGQKTNPHFEVHNALRALKIDARSWANQSADYHLSAKGHISQVRQALKERKTAPGLEALDALETRVSGMDQVMKLLIARITSRQQLYTAKYEAWSPPLTSGEPEVTMDDDGNPLPQANGTLQSLVDEAYTLCQAFPTVQHLPTSSAENTLRAMIALLRHHQWEGAETLTQEGGSNGKEKQPEDVAVALTELAAAAGKPEPVGVKPGQYDDEGSDADD